MSSFSELTMTPTKLQDWKITIQLQFLWCIKKVTQLSLGISKCHISLKTFLLIS